METQENTGESPFDQLPENVATSQAVVFLNRPGPDFGYLNNSPKRADWPDNITLKVGGVDKSYPCTYLDRDMIEDGNYTHPVNGKKIPAGKQQLSQWVDTFHKMQTAGIELYIPCDHANGARSNLGFVKDAKIVDHPDGKQRLRLTHQFIGEDAPLIALRNRGSLGIDPDYVDAKGKRWGSAIIHSAVTPDPVIFGMGAFTPTQLSRKEGEAAAPPDVYFFEPSTPADPAAAEVPTKPADQPAETTARSSSMDPIDPAVRAKLIEFSRSRDPETEAEDEAALKSATDAVLLARVAKEMEAMAADTTELAQAAKDMQTEIELSRTQLAEAKEQATAQINLSRDELAKQSSREILMSREGQGVMSERWMRLNEKCERLAKQGWTPAAIARIKHSTIGTMDLPNVFNLSRDGNEVPCAADAILDVLLEYKPDDPGVGELQELSRIDPRVQDGGTGNESPRINPHTGKPIGQAEAELKKQNAA